MSALALAGLILGVSLGAEQAPLPEGHQLLGQIETYQRKLFDRLAPSVVFVRSKEGFGSGFFVTAQGLILTNNHVVKDCKSVDVVLHDGRRLAGTVVARAGEDVDLALVQVPLQDTPAPPLESVKGLSVGAWVGSIGHGAGAVWTFNTGMVSNIYFDGMDRPVFQTQIPLNPGNSGGPIFDRLGRVVGVVTAGIKDANAMNFSISIDLARRTLKQLADSSDCLTILAPEKVPVFVDNVMVGAGPRVVLQAVPGKTYNVFAIIEGRMARASAAFPEIREVTLK
ncbi:MAG: trypsin-like peptidase domain-containing protein [Deltaproteobacteria bacterium]|nr:trypsin-like peptidase domain-containing protein [Deltaproteobacteria bacterium]